MAVTRTSYLAARSPMWVNVIGCMCMQTQTPGLACAPVDVLPHALGLADQNVFAHHARACMPTAPDALSSRLHAYRPTRTCTCEQVQPEGRNLRLDAGSNKTRMLQRVSVRTGRHEAVVVELVVVAVAHARHLARVGALDALKDAVAVVAHRAARPPLLLVLHIRGECERLRSRKLSCAWVRQQKTCADLLTTFGSRKTLLEARHR